MQAMPISNPSPANAPSPAAATLLPFDPQSSSPFTAVFHAVLKGTGNTPKIPVAGKPQDSSREPARTTGTASTLFGLFPQGLAASTLAPILPEQSHTLSAAPVVPDIAFAHGPAALSNSLPLEKTATLAINSQQTNGTPPATAVLTAIASSTGTTSNFLKGEGALPNLLSLEATATPDLKSFPTNSTPPATAVLSASPPLTTSASNFLKGEGALPNLLSLEATAAPTLKSFPTNIASLAAAALTATLPSRASASNFAKGVAPLSNPLSLEATASPVINSFQTNSASLAAAALTATPPPTASGSNFAKGGAALSSPLALEAMGSPVMNFVKINDNPHAPAALTATPPSKALAGNFTDTVHVSDLPQDLNADTPIAANVFGPPSVTDSSSGASQPVAPSPSTAPGATAAQMDAPESNALVKPMNVFITVAAGQTTPIAPVPDSNFVPQDPGLSPNPVGITDPSAGSQPQPQANPEISPSSPQNILVTGPNPLNTQIAPVAHANSSFLSMGTLIPVAAATKVFVTSSAQPASNQWGQSTLQPLASVPAAPAETLAHSVAKSAAMGVSAFKFHEDLQPPGANPALPAPVSTMPAKTQTQDPSNGSSGNDSNAKPDGTSKVAGARTDGKNFVQSLDTAGPNPMSGHSATADSTAAAAAPPSQAQIANSGAPPSASGAAESRPTESLPGSAQNAPVVSAAHIVNQSGQTEIRIEMQADSLGGVELRAHIAGDQIGASIAVEHHDAQMALATDLPALHSALVEKNLRVETLTVSQGNFSSLSGNSGQDGGQRGFPQSPAKFAYLEQPERAQAFTEGPAEWAGSSNSSSGLSVVA
jgi:flagellar hook-length control protein FliK